MDSTQGVENPFLWAILVPGDFETCRKTVASVIKKHARDCDLDGVDPRKLGQYLAEIRGAESYHAFGLRHGTPADLADLEDVFAHAVSEQLAGTVFSLTLWTEERVFAYQNGRLCDEEPDVPPYTLARKKGCPLRPKKNVVIEKNPESFSVCILNGIDVETLKAWMARYYRIPVLPDGDYEFVPRSTGLLVYGTRHDVTGVLEAVTRDYPHVYGYDVDRVRNMDYYGFLEIRGEICNMYCIPPIQEGMGAKSFLGETDPKRILEKLDIPQEVMDLPRTYERDEFEVD